jgi:hypothetical protein
MPADPAEENSAQTSDDEDIIRLKFERNLFFGAVLFLGIGILLFIVTVLNHIVLAREIPEWEIAIGSAAVGALATLLVLSTTQKK